MNLDSATAPAALRPTENAVAAPEIRAVLFDLDGTLVDPAGAITSCLSHALGVHGIEIPEQAVLDSFVGPPLADSLASLPGVTQALIPSIVEVYRQRYLDEGMQASRVYPGIEELLGTLNAAGVVCAVATSKPTGLAERLLSIQGIREHFAAVQGSAEDESIPHAGKGPILGAALAEIGLDPARGPLAEIAPQARVVMVGDRIFDVDGAAEHGLDCIGVRWGYAPSGELETAGAKPIVSTAERLEEALVSAGILVPAKQLAYAPGYVRFVAPRSRQTID
ncbi:HAD hydrolase-like protein [Nesterenkonia jeotgali]|uniref:Phosphoglycolate phosphatase n=1 Tax=Nesterenkonia jeotgali TaxID=317018 RepID=A0A839FSX8_9MICC|nr:HAD hydrolase-like protein [Nesterenkonia jeotgali]MBA8920993.1 phosphoglycolate phosphatase [Nesterenkonia jeotgali]